MEEAISQFFTGGSRPSNAALAGTAVLALSIVIVTFFVRRIVETAVPTAKKQNDENHPGITYMTTFARWWNSVILYAIPVVVGGAIGWAHVPYLFSVEGLDTVSSRIFFGGVVGWLSSFFYKVIRMTLKKKTGVDINPTPSVMPGADSSE